MSDEKFSVRLAERMPDSEVSDLHQALLVLLGGRQWNIAITAVMNVVLTSLNRDDISVEQMHWFMSQLDAFVGIAMKAHEAAHIRAGENGCGPQDEEEPPASPPLAGPDKPIIH